MTEVENLGEAVWQALARHGYLINNEARDAVLAALRPAEDGRVDALPDDVRDLVIAAREIAFSDNRPVGAPETRAEVEMIELFDGMTDTNATFWTYADVEDRMVEAVRLAWRDEPGNWPFAGDGPWHLIWREFGDHGAHDAPPVPRLPLTRAERARMEQAMGWLGAIGEGDRRLVLMTLRSKAADRKPDWSAMLRRLGQRRGAGGLERRYSQALAGIVRRLHGAGLPIVRAG